MPILRSASSNNSKKKTKNLHDQAQSQPNPEPPLVAQVERPSPPSRKRSLRLSSKASGDTGLSPGLTSTKGTRSENLFELSPVPEAPVCKLKAGNHDLDAGKLNLDSSPSQTLSNGGSSQGRVQGKRKTRFLGVKPSVAFDNIHPQPNCDQDMFLDSVSDHPDSPSQQIAASNKRQRFSQGRAVKGKSEMNEDEDNLDMRFSHNVDLGNSEMCKGDDKHDKKFSHNSDIVSTSEMCEDMNKLDQRFSHDNDVVELCKADKLDKRFPHTNDVGGTSEIYKDNEKVVLSIDLGEVPEDNDAALGASNVPYKQEMDSEMMRPIQVQAEEAETSSIAEEVANGDVLLAQAELDMAGPSDAVVREEEAVSPRGNARGRRNRAEASRARFLQIARERAFHFAHFDANGNEAPAGNIRRRGQQQPPLHQQPRSQEAQADWPGPFSTARQLVENRALAAANRQNAIKCETKISLVDWHPRDSSDASLEQKQICPSLQDLCLEVLSNNSENVASLEGVPEFIRTLISVSFCKRRKMNAKALSLFFQGSPTEIRAPDCTQVPEAEMTEMMGQLSAERLEELHLGFCGRALSEKCLLSTICKSAVTYPLKSVSLCGAYRLTDKGLESLLQSSPNLSHLDLSSCSFLTNMAMKAIVRCTSDTLESLVLDGCANLNAESIVHDLVKLPKLQKLSLSAVGGVTDEIVSELGVQMGGQLRELSLAHCISLTDAAIAGIGACCPSLQVLNLSYLSLLTDISIAHITDGLRALRALDLRRCKFSDEGVAAFVTASGGSLVNFSVNSVQQVGEQTLLALAKHSNASLQQLDVSFCRSVTDECLGFLADCCPHLSVLKLFGCTQVTEKFLKGHRNCNLAVVGL